MAVSTVSILRRSVSPSTIQVVFLQVLRGIILMEMTSMASILSSPSLFSSDVSCQSRLPNCSVRDRRNHKKWFRKRELCRVSSSLNVRARFDVSSSLNFFLFQGFLFFSLFKVTCWFTGGIDVPYRSFFVLFHAPLHRYHSFLKTRQSTVKV